MTAPRWASTAAAVSAGLLILVLGAALRPVVLPEHHTAAPILDAVEVGFAQDMVAHHQQALLLVQRLDHTADPTVVRLADQLDDTQRIELGTMLGWLRLAGAAPTAAQPMSWLHTDQPASPHHSTMAAGQQPSAGATMPGSVGTAELDALSQAQGRAAEILFLQLMYRHHEGGMAMAAAADSALRSGPVKELARSMLQQQGQECGLMGMLLTQRGAQPIP